MGAGHVARERELGAVDPAQQEVLNEQIASLHDQQAAYQAIVDARDLSPGTMRIGVNPDSDSID